VTDSRPVQAAILGTGDLGCALIDCLLESQASIELSPVAGAAAIADDPGIQLVFEASDAPAPAAEVAWLGESGKTVVNVTPGGSGPYVVPAVTPLDWLARRKVDLATFPAQIAVPIVRAFGAFAQPLYSEVVTTIASAAFGKAFRQSFDEFTVATARALEQLGGAKRGKSITVVSPADPPLVMGTTVYVVGREPFDTDGVVAAVSEIVGERYPPECRLKIEPTCVERETPWGVRPTLVAVVETEGRGPGLPRHAGNLAVIARAARAAGEALAQDLALESQALA
jgi:acetaldehyde dehydrogenase